MSPVRSFKLDFQSKTKKADKATSPQTKSSKKKFQRASNGVRRGFTLLETVVYIALLTIVTTFLASFILDLSRSFNKARIKADVASQARRALELITKEIKEAKSVYTPTSYFGTGGSQRQLSLETLYNIPTGENSTFVDFYLDNQKIYQKRENQAAESITSDRVKITNLTFDLISSNNIVIKIDAQFNTTSIDPAYQAQISLESSATLRSY